MSFDNKLEGVSAQVRQLCRLFSCAAMATASHNRISLLLRSWMIQKSKNGFADFSAPELVPWLLKTKCHEPSHNRNKVSSIKNKSISGNDLWEEESVFVLWEESVRSGMYCLSNTRSQTTSVSGISRKTLSPSKVMLDEPIIILKSDSLMS